MDLELGGYLHQKLKPAPAQVMPQGGNLDPRIRPSGGLLTKLDFVLDICFSISSQETGGGDNLYPFYLYDRNSLLLCATVYQAKVETSTEEHEMISEVAHT